MTKKTSKTLWTVAKIIESVIIIAAGIMAIIYSGSSDLQRWIFIVIGVFITLDGLIRLFRFYANGFDDSLHKRGILYAVLEVSFGLLLCIKPEVLPSIINDLLVLFFAILFLASGVILVLDASFGLAHRKRKVSFAVFEYILAALLLAAGILLIINIGQDIVIRSAIIFVGALLTVFGVLLLVSVFHPLKIRSDF